MSRHNCILLLDVGGTALKSALGTRKGGPVSGSFLSGPMPSGGTREQIEEAFRSLLDRQFRQASELQYRIEGVAAAVPGPFDYRDGVFLMRHKFASVYGCSFKELLGLADYMRTSFVHDVNGALLGNLELEGRQGNCALVTLGTGLGFACAENGNILMGENGSPLYSLYDLPFRDGILEDYVSRRGIIRSFESLGGAPGLDVEQIAALARAGDAAALETFDLTGRLLAEGAGPLVKRLATGTLLFGGRISLSFPLLEPSLRSGFGEGIALKPSQDINGAVLRGLSTLLTETY